MSNKLQKKFAICCLILMLITPFTTSYAVSVEECGKALAEYSLSFVKATTADNSKVKTHYYVADWDQADSERAYAWKDMQSPKCNHNNFGNGVTDLGMDCVGWASYAIHHCYGLGGEDFQCFVSPSPSTARDPFTIVHSPNSSDYKEGDILISSTHVMIYVGNGEVVHSWNSNGGHPGVVKTEIKGTVLDLARITDSGASNITSLVKSYNGTAVAAGSSKGASGTPINYSNFFFNGIPDGKYSLATKTSLFEKIINKIAELYELLTGLMAYLFRGLIIGIVSIFDRLINNTVQSIDDAPKDLKDAGVQATSADDPSSMHRSVTIESLVFNELDLFDINIFKVE